MEIWSMKLDNSQNRWNHKVNMISCILTTNNPLLKFQKITLWMIWHFACYYNEDFKNPQCWYPWMFVYSFYTDVRIQFDPEYVRWWIYLDPLVTSNTQGHREQRAISSYPSSLRWMMSRTEFAHTLTSRILMSFVLLNGRDRGQQYSLSSAKVLLSIFSFSSIHFDN